MFEGTFDNDNANSQQLFDLVHLFQITPDPIQLTTFSMNSKKKKQQQRVKTNDKMKQFKIK